MSSVAEQQFLLVNTMALNTKDIRRILPSLDRALLYFLEAEGFIEPTKAKAKTRTSKGGDKGKAKPTRSFRSFDDEQVWRLSVLARYSEAGYSFRRATNSLTNLHVCAIAEFTRWRGECASPSIL